MVARPNQQRSENSSTMFPQLQPHLQTPGDLTLVIPPRAAPGEGRRQTPGSNLQPLYKAVPRVTHVFPAPRCRRGTLAVPEAKAGVSSSRSPPTPARCPSGNTQGKKKRDERLNPSPDTLPTRRSWIPAPPPSANKSAAARYRSPLLEIYPRQSFNAPL